MVHNPPVRRLLAACLLVLFATLATADTLVCPDGCLAARSQAVATQCNASGQCVFCTGGIVTHAPQVVVEPITGPVPVRDVPQQAPPIQPALALDHPPRLD
jgi:hypothetical protein